MKRQKPSETVPFNPTLPKLRKLLKKTRLVVFGECRGFVKSFEAECAENFSITLTLLEVNRGSRERPVWHACTGSDGYTLQDLDVTTFDWVEAEFEVTATRVVSKGKMKQTFIYTFITSDYSAKA